MMRVAAGGSSGRTSYRNFRRDHAMHARPDFQVCAAISRIAEGHARSQPRETAGMLRHSVLGSARHARCAAF
eukprot:2459719-Pyramimonas_sp.AAC.1